MVISSVVFFPSFSPIVNVCDGAVVVVVVVVVLVSRSVSVQVILDISVLIVGNPQKCNLVPFAIANNVPAG